MVSKLLKFCLNLLLLSLLVLSANVYAEFKVDWDIQNTVKTEAPLRDLEIAPQGLPIFILTGDGNVHVYDGEVNLIETIKVGTHIDEIKYDPMGVRLFAISRQNNTIEVITLNFINVAGSPSKGPDGAPVVVAIFSDFQ